MWNPKNLFKLLQNENKGKASYGMCTVSRADRFASEPDSDLENENENEYNPDTDQDFDRNFADETTQGNRPMQGQYEEKDTYPGYGGGSQDMNNPMNNGGQLSPSQIITSKDQFYSSNMANGHGYGPKSQNSPLQSDSSQHSGYYQPNMNGGKFMLSPQQYGGDRTGYIMSNSPQPNPSFNNQYSNIQGNMPQMQMNSNFSGMKDHQVQMGSNFTSMKDHQVQMGSNFSGMKDHQMQPRMSVAHSSQGMYGMTGHHMQHPTGTPNIPQPVPILGVNIPQDARLSQMQIMQQLSNPPTLPSNGNKSVYELNPIRIDNPQAFMDLPYEMQANVLNNLGPYQTILPRQTLEQMKSESNINGRMQGADGESADLISSLAAQRDNPILKNIHQQLQEKSMAEAMRNFQQQNPESITSTITQFTRMQQQNPQAMPNQMSAQMNQVPGLPPQMQQQMQSPQMSQQFSQMQRAQSVSHQQPLQPKQQLQHQPPNQPLMQQPQFQLRQNSIQPNMNQQQQQQQQYAQYEYQKMMQSNQAMPYQGPQSNQTSMIPSQQKQYIPLDHMQAQYDGNTANVPSQNAVDHHSDEIGNDDNSGDAYNITRVAVKIFTISTNTKRPNDAINDGSSDTLSRREIVLYRLLDDPELLEIEAFFSVEECAHIIGLTNGMTARTFDMKNESISVYHLVKHDQYIATLRRRAAKCLGGNLESVSNPVIYRFEATLHQDIATSNTFSVADAEHQFERILLVYLNGELEGGEIEMPNLGIAILPKQGYALSWKNVGPDGQYDYRIFYKNLPVLKGTMYCLVFYMDS